MDENRGDGCPSLDALTLDCLATISKVLTVFGDATLQFSKSGCTIHEVSSFSSSSAAAS